MLNEAGRYLGYLLVICATGIITVLGYSGIVYILPYYSDTWSLLYIINLLAGYYSTILIPPPLFLLSLN